MLHALAAPRTAALPNFFICIAEENAAIPVSRGKYEAITRTIPSLPVGAEKALRGPHQRLRPRSFLLALTSRAYPVCSILPLIRQAGSAHSDWVCCGNDPTIGRTRQSLPARSQSGHKCLQIVTRHPPPDPSVIANDVGGMKHPFVGLQGAWNMCGHKPRGVASHFVQKKVGLAN